MVQRKFADSSPLSIVTKIIGIAVLAICIIPLYFQHYIGASVDNNPFITYAYSLVPLYALAAKVVVIENNVKKVEILGVIIILTGVIAGAILYFSAALMDINSPWVTPLANIALEIILSAVAGAGVSAAT